jgi:hypothetical protein
MPYQTKGKRSKRATRKPIDVHQNRFPKAYISTIDNSRRPVDSLSDMTNYELVQDNVARPRPPLVRYGTQPDLPVVGRGEYRYNGQGYCFGCSTIPAPARFINKQTAVFLLLGGTYSVSGWSRFCQSKAKSTSITASISLVILIWRQRR